MAATKMDSIQVKHLLVLFLLRCISIKFPEAKPRWKNKAVRISSKSNKILVSYAKKNIADGA